MSLFRNWFSRSNLTAPVMPETTPAVMKIRSMTMAGIHSMNIGFFRMLDLFFPEGASW